MTEHDDRPQPYQPDGTRDHERRDDRDDETHTDVMGAPDRAAETDDVIGGENKPPPGDDVMAPDGGDGETYP